MEQAIDIVLKYFNAEFRKAVTIACKDNLIEEIRIRANKPCVIHTATRSFCIKKPDDDSCFYFSFNDIEDIVCAFCNHSLFAFDKDIKNGFITLEGGIRVGISGEGIYKNGKLSSIRKFGCINIRIPRQITGVSKRVMPYIYEKNEFLNTLILSPPNCGKTTLVRDIAKSISDGDDKKRKKVFVVDERGELCGNNGQLDIGDFSDASIGIKKDAAVFMALRSMSPQVIVMDEVGTKDDAKAMLEIVNCGVKIVATAHTHDIESFKRRSFFLEVLNERIIDRFIVLGDLLGRGTVCSVLDKDLKPICTRPFRLM